MAKRTSIKTKNQRSLERSKSSIQKLNDLFESVSPKELREDLIEIYHMYIIHSHDALPNNFPKMASNIFLLIESLGKLTSTNDQ
jgi:hypothetical protein